MVELDAAGNAHGDDDETVIDVASVFGDVDDTVVVVVDDSDEDEDDELVEGETSAWNVTHAVGEGTDVEAAATTDDDDKGLALMDAVRA